jgi:hypothetical protein
MEDDMANQKTHMIYLEASARAGKHDEETLSRLIGRRDGYADGHGCGFGGEDFSWYFGPKSDAKATEAAKKLSKQKGLRVALKWLNEDGDTLKSVRF